jgi:hypothetical protein
VTLTLTGPARAPAARRDETTHPTGPATWNSRYQAFPGAPSRTRTDTWRILSLNYCVSRYASTALDGRLPAEMVPACLSAIRAISH